MNSIAERLRQLEKILQLKPSSMAKIGGCSRSTYYRYRNGKSVPDLDFLKKFLNYETNLNPDWIVNGNGKSLRSYTGGRFNNLSGDKASAEARVRNNDGLVFYQLPVYQMSVGNGGEGRLHRDEWGHPDDLLPFTGMFLEGMLNIDDPLKLIAIHVQCNSMAPTIKPDSLVLVDTQQNQIGEDASYLISFDGVIRMKFAEKLPGQRIRFSTFNHNYTPFELSGEGLDQIEVMGRIIWVGKKL